MKEKRLKLKYQESDDFYVIILMAQIYTWCGELQPILKNKVEIL